MRSDAELLAHANLQKVSYLYLPGLNYDSIRAKTRLTPEEQSRLHYLLNDHPDIDRSKELHFSLLKWIDRKFACSKEVEESEKFRKYMSALGCFLEAYNGRFFLSAFKALEFLNFAEIEPEAFGEDTLEIGVSDGIVSRGYFEKGSIETGAEYLWQRLLGTELPHRHRMACDVRALPFADNTFRSIFLVHVFDNLTEDMMGAFDEIRRVLKPGGKLYMAMMSDAYGHHQSKEKINNLIDLTDDEYTTYATARYSLPNLLSRTWLEQIATEHGYRRVEYREVLGPEVSWIWDIGQSLESGAAISSLHRKTKNPLLRWARYREVRNLMQSCGRKIFCLESNSSGPGISAYCVLEKKAE